MITGFKKGAYIFLNTPEIRERLEELGYKKNESFYSVKNGDCILTYPHYREDCPNEIYPHYLECTKDYFEGPMNWCANRIDCGTDIEKFFEIVSEKV